MGLFVSARGTLRTDSRLVDSPPKAFAGGVSAAIGRWIERRLRAAGYRVVDLNASGRGSVVGGRLGQLEDQAGVKVSVDLPSCECEP